MRNGAGGAALNYARKSLPTAARAPRQEHHYMCDSCGLKCVPGCTLKTYKVVLNRKMEYVKTEATEYVGHPQI